MAEQNKTLSAEDVIRLSASTTNKAFDKRIKEIQASLSVEQNHKQLTDIQSQMIEMKDAIAEMKKVLEIDSDADKSICQTWSEKSNDLQTKIDDLNKTGLLSSDSYKALKDEINKLKEHVSILNESMDNQAEFDNRLLQSEQVLGAVVDKLGDIDKNLLASAGKKPKFSLDELKEGAPKNYQDFIDRLHNEGIDEFIVPVPLANGRVLNVDLATTPFMALPMAVKMHFENGFGMTEANITQQKMNLTPVSAQEAWSALIGDQVSSQTLTNDQSKMKFDQLPKSVQEALANNASPEEIRRLFEEEMKKQQQPIGPTGALLGLASKAIETLAAPITFIFSKERQERMRNLEYANAQAAFNESIKEVDTQLRAMMKNPQYAALVNEFGSKNNSGGTIELGKKEEALSNFLGYLNDPKNADAVSQFQLKPELLASRMNEISQKAERLQKAAANKGMDDELQQNPYNKALQKFEEWQGLAAPLAAAQVPGQDEKSLKEAMEKSQNRIQELLDSLMEKLGKIFSRGPSLT